MKIFYMILFVIISLVTNAQSIDALKYKAMFTVNFIRFIDWQEENKQNDFVIGVLNNKNLSLKLSELSATKKVGFQKIVIENYKTIDDIGKCEILYVTSNNYFNKKKFLQLNNKIGTYPTLLITEVNNGIEYGSMINFVIVDNRLKFELNITGLIDAGFNISNSLKALNNAIVK